MSELGEMYRALREDSQFRKTCNHDKSLAILKEKGYNPKKLSPTHYRVQDWDYWPSTGLFINIETKKRGRGVFGLLKLLTKD